MNYIGSKLSLLSFLDKAITDIAGNEWDVFCDLFAGTGIVGVHFKKKSKRIIANDIQYYSYVLTRHYIGNCTPLEFDGLVPELPELKGQPLELRSDLVCSHLSRIAGAEGFIYRNYCLGGTRDQEEPRQYFSDENGMLCDAIRTQIEEWMRAGVIDDDEYFFLLASLLESIDEYANTASVYGAFLKHIKKTAQRHMTLRPAELIPGSRENEVYNEDVNMLVSRIEGDVLYLDPPYNHRQYATNYHLLETIALYDNPELHGKTGLRDYANQKSRYCMKREVSKAFKDLILNARFKYIFLSYNNEGLLSFDEIREIMSLRGKYDSVTREHSRFKADRDANRSYKADKTIEYLHYVKCEGN